MKYTETIKLNKIHKSGTYFDFLNSYIIETNELVWSESEHEIKNTLLENNIHVISWLDEINTTSYDNPAQWAQYVLSCDINDCTSINGWRNFIVHEFYERTKNHLLGLHPTDYGFTSSLLCEDYLKVGVIYYDHATENVDDAQREINKVLQECNNFFDKKPFEVNVYDGVSRELVKHGTAFYDPSTGKNDITKRLDIQCNETHDVIY